MPRDCGLVREAGRLHVLRSRCRAYELQARRTARAESCRMSQLSFEAMLGPEIREATRSGVPPDEAAAVARCSYFGSKVNFWPPMLASNIRPPVPMVKMATPLS